MGAEFLTVRDKVLGGGGNKGGLGATGWRRCFHWILLERGVGETRIVEGYILRRDLIKWLSDIVIYIVY